MIIWAIKVLKTISSAFILWFYHFLNTRAEFVKFFRWYFGPNDDTKRTFWNELTSKDWCAAIDEVKQYYFGNDADQIADDGVSSTTWRLKKNRQTEWWSVIICGFCRKQICDATI